MVVAEMENLRIRVTDRINESLTAFSDDKRISKQDTIEGLLAWFLDQDEMLQLLLVGRVPEKYRSQTARMVLETISGAKSAAHYGKRIGDISQLVPPREGSDARASRPRRAEAEADRPAAKMGRAK